MILDEHFERIVILSLPRSADRAERALRELKEKNLSETASVVRAVDGRISEPSDWWQAGPGSWGCMMSHFRAVQDALLDGVETLLVLEDDCVWQNNAAAMAHEVMTQLPADWGQLYFGGQHRASQRPEWIEGKPAVQRAKSIHRTHAYAIHRRAMVPFLKHILYAPDYLEAKAKSGEKRHVDHQLEHAQRRGDWPVYCASWWLAGQGENLSLINGRPQREQWWQIGWQECYRKLPVIVCDRAPTVTEMRRLHFGKHLLEADPTHDVGLMGATTKDDFIRVASLISGEALACQRLPGVNGSDLRHTEWLRSKWLGPVILLSESPDLDALCDFPNSKLISHPWLNPATPRRAPVEEPSASTEETALAEALQQVHQVWIGDKEMPPRLAAYCETIARAFPGWQYKLWQESDMAALAENAVMPEVVADTAFPIGIRSDVIRLEILRQHGGVYFDTDFEALRPNLAPMFSGKNTFFYSDQKSGDPSNAMMGAGAPGNPFVEFMLRRIQAVIHIPENIWQTVHLTGPNKLSECLNLWVTDWKKNQPLTVGDERLGSLYAGGSIAGFWHERFYPYHYEQSTWAAFDPAAYPAAWAAHHWEGGWHRAPEV